MKEARIFIIYMRFLSFLIQDAVNTTYISALMSPLSKRKSERTRVQHLVLLRQRRVWKGEDSGHQSMTRTLLGSTTVPKLRSQGHPRPTLPPGSAFHAPPPPGPRPPVILWQSPPGHTPDFTSSQCNTKSPTACPPRCVPHPDWLAAHANAIGSDRFRGRVPGGDLNRDWVFSCWAKSLLIGHHFGREVATWWRECRGRASLGTLAKIAGLMPAERLWRGGRGAPPIRGGGHATIPYTNPSPTC